MSSVASSLSSSSLSLSASGDLRKLTLIGLNVTIPACRTLPPCCRVPWLLIALTDQALQSCFEKPPKLQGWPATARCTGSVCCRVGTARQVGARRSQRESSRTRRHARRCEADQRRLTLAPRRPPRPAAQPREKVGGGDGRRRLVQRIKDTTSGGRRWVGGGAGRSDGAMDLCRGGSPGRGRRDGGSPDPRRGKSARGGGSVRRLGDQGCMAGAPAGGRPRRQAPSPQRVAAPTPRRLLLLPCRTCPQRPKMRVG